MKGSSKRETSKLFEMAKSKGELCGSCCKGSQPNRKSDECNVCACGAPFFTKIVEESNLPTSRRCLIGIPMEFIEDHGSRLDYTVIFEEEGSDSDGYRVKIGGNKFVGFGFEWKDFAQLHNIGIDQRIVFTLVRNSRFLVQIYKPGSPSPIATKPQRAVKVEQTCSLRTQFAPRVEDDDDDDIEECVAEDWLAAKASRSNMTYPVLPSKVKVENVFLETLTGQATPSIEKPGGIDAKGQQKGGIIPKLEPEAEVINIGYSLRQTSRQKSPVITIPAVEEREKRPSHQSSESEENEDSDPSSTSDSAWSPTNSSPCNGRRRNAKRGASSDDNSEDEDEEEEDGAEDELVLNKVERRGKRLFKGGSSKAKRTRSSDMDTGTETDCPSANDEGGATETKSRLLVEGCIVKKHGHDWHVAGTKRGRTYVSKRRAVTEDEKEKTLARARQVQINNPSFLKQLHKDSCYRSLKLFPPMPFYRDNMIPATQGSYKATLEDANGDKWSTRIMGMKIFWKHFTLDHNLEEDDVVVFELMDPRHESVRFLVHIFRVVDIQKSLIGKEGWALYYNVVEGTKKQYFEERRRLLKAQGLKKQKKQKLKRKSGSSSNPKSASEITEFYRSKKNPEVTEFYKRSSVSQKEKRAPVSPSAYRDQVEPQTLWKRPTTRIRSREMNRRSDELNEPINIKHELEEVLGDQREVARGCSWEGYNGGCSSL